MKTIAVLLHRRPISFSLQQTLTVLFILPIIVHVYCDLFLEINSLFSVFSEHIFRTVRRFILLSSLPVSGYSFSIEAPGGPIVQRASFRRRSTVRRLSFDSLVRILREPLNISSHSALRLENISPRYAFPFLLRFASLIPTWPRENERLARLHFPPWNGRVGHRTEGERTSED